MSNQNHIIKKHITDTRRVYSVVLTVILLTIFVNANVTADTMYPVGKDPFALDYHLAYRVGVSSQNLDILQPVGPYYYSTFNKIQEYREQSASLQIFSQTPKSDIRLFSFLKDEIKIERDSAAQNYTGISLGGQCQLSNDFGALFMFSLDRARAVDPDYTGKIWRGMAGEIENAAIYYKKSNLSLILGRQKVFWGPQPVNLMLSETAEPLDMFSLHYEKGRLRFTFLFARLDQSRPDSVDYLRFPDYSFNDNRYLAGHRLDITLHKYFRLGLFETSLFGGEGRSPELYYFNPLQFFHTVQLNENIDDNTILGLDFTCLPRRGFNIYCQLLIDDFQIDRKAQGDQEPDEIGLLAGFFKTGTPGSLLPDIKLEYTGITNRTYHQINPRNRYLFRNKLLGHPLGPDSDSLSLMIRFWLNSKKYIELETAYSRHGEGSIYSSWDTPWLDCTGDYSEPFPTGVVEKTYSLRALISGYLTLTDYTSRHLYVSIEGGYNRINNHNHINDKKSSFSWLYFSLNWFGAWQINVE